MFNVSKYAKAGASLGGHGAACLDTNAVCRHFQERKAVGRLAFTVAQRKTLGNAVTRRVVWGQSEIVVW